MYNEFFGFSEAPFSIAPDPRYLYMSGRHSEALAHLLYGIRGEGGVVLLTGEVGTGKTTVCRCLLEQLPEDCDVAFIFNPKLNIEELLSTICDELRIPYPSRLRSIKRFVNLINRHLLAAHARRRKTILIIDEAQNLGIDVLEQLRLLTNLETNQRKLLQIILLGQPELRERLAMPELCQLEQRIIARYHLDKLSRQEVAAYVSHRLGVAGVRRSLFPSRVLSRLYRYTRGTPRLINVICDRALLGAYVQGNEVVDRRTLDSAAREVLGEHRLPSAGRRLGWAVAALAATGVLAGLIATYPFSLAGRLALSSASAPTAAIPVPLQAGSPTGPASHNDARAPRLAD